MKLRLMNLTAGEEAIRLMVNRSRFYDHWVVYMHPVVAIDGGWFLPDHSGAELRQIWLHKGSIRSLMPKVIKQEVWSIWHDIEGVVAAIPTAVIHNTKTGAAVMLNLVNDLGINVDQVKLSLAANNALVRELPSLFFTEKQASDEPDDVMMWLCRAFLDPGQSHLAIVNGDYKQVVA